MNNNVKDTRTEEDKRASSRFIGKIRRFTGAFGEYFKILIDNPNPVKADGSADPYYKGSLIWYDAQTQKHYTIKQIGIKGVSEASQARGDTNSLMIDLGNSYQVTLMQS